MRMIVGRDARGMISLEKKDAVPLCDCERDDRAQTLPNLPSVSQRQFAEIRRVVREELRAHQDRQSFAAAAGLLTIDEASEYLRISRAEFNRRRHARKIAKTNAEKDAAFAPEYGTGRIVKFKRVELDAWIEGQRR